MWFHDRLFDTQPVSISKQMFFVLESSRMKPSTGEAMLVTSPALDRLLLQVSGIWKDICCGQCTHKGPPIFPSDSCKGATRQYLWVSVLTARHPFPTLPNTPIDGVGQVEGKQMKLRKRTPPNFPRFYFGHIRTTSAVVGSTQLKQFYTAISWIWAVGFPIKAWHRNAGYTLNSLQGQSIASRSNCSWQQNFSELNWSRSSAQF